MNGLDGAAARQELQAVIPALAKVESSLTSACSARRCAPPLNRQVVMRVKGHTKGLKRFEGSQRMGYMAER